MPVPSGLVLPGDRPLPVREVAKGLYLVGGAYERDYGFFGRSPLYCATGGEVMRVYLDLDGVLADFVGGALALFGRPPDDRDRVDRWGLHDCLGLAEGDFWAAVDRRGEDFWAGLDWTPDGRQILGLVEGAFGAENVCVASSPGRSPSSAAGKLRWIQRHLPGYARRYLLGPAKDFQAGPGRLLIDDSDSNVAAFRAAGGKAILVARPWNALRDDADAALAYLRGAVRAVVGSAAAGESEV